MIIVKIQGGLGNQMFQYAYGYALAKRYGMKMTLDTHSCDIYEYKKLPFLIKLFESKYINKLLRLIKVGKIHLPKFIYYLQIHFDFRNNEEEFKKNKNVYISGYWQDPRFFKSYEKDLVKEFTPKYAFKTSVKKIINNIESNNSVSVHVRRGDYLLKKNRRFQIKDEYYQKAIKKISDNVDQPKLYFFSDDIDWCKKYFKDVVQATFINLEGENADINEMMCISRCKHNINANSSFSWWASWLNNNCNKIVICPDRYWNRGMIPKDWIVIENVAFTAKI